MYPLFSQKEFLISYILLIFVSIIFLCYLIFAQLGGFFPFYKKLKTVFNTDTFTDVYDSIILDDIVVTKIQEGNQPATLIRNNAFRVFYKYDYEITLEPSERKFIKEGKYTWFNQNNIDVTINDLFLTLSSFSYQLLVKNKDSKKVKLKITRTIGTSNVRREDSSFNSLESGEIITYLYSTTVLLDNFEDITENIFLTDTINIV